VAARLSDEAAAGRLQPTPFVLTFKTAAPVYPMRLTGVGNGPISLTLFVIADGIAAAPGMTVEHSDGVYELMGDLHTQQNWRGLAHEGLLALFLSNADRDGVAWGTRLSGMLTPAAQKQDLQIAVTAGVYSRRELYTPRAASSVGWDFGGLVFGLTLLPLAAWTLVRKRTARWLLTGSAAALVLGGAVGLVVAGTLPALPGGVRYTKPAERNSKALAESIRRARPGSEAQIRSWIAGRRAEGESPWSELAQESDGPDGWRLRTDENGMLWLDVFDYAARKSGSEPLSEKSKDAPVSK
jgi:hypothetical protein